MGTAYRQVFALSTVSITILIVIGFIYGFHLYGDETLCPDRESLIHKIANLKQQVHDLKLQHSNNPNNFNGIVSANSVSNEVSLPGAGEVSLGSPALRQLIFRQNTRYWYETEPYFPTNPLPVTEKYLTFAPWHGGFNNIRMSLEMAFAAAYAMKRTLVLPPKFRMYLRGTSSLEDYFDFEHIRRGIPTIQFEEFAKRVNLAKYSSIDTNSVHSNADKHFEALKQLPGVMIHGKEYLGNKIGSQLVYCSPECPKKPLLRTEENRNQRKFFENFSKKLTPINVNDPQTEQATVVHFPPILLGHFYTMFWFKDPQEGRRLMRLVRDHIHFKEEIFEMAEYIINQLGDFQYSCYHIRRNEFQFDEAWTPAEDIVKNTEKLFKSGEKIYIATDEVSSGKKKDSKNWHDPTAMAKVQEHTWFNPMREKFGNENVFFLSDFYNELEKRGLEKIHIGCIETIVCARARVFVGTRKSTFSGYINRLRGYMHDVGQKEILDAQSKYPDDYYYTKQGPSWSLFPSGSFGGGHPYWGREYKEAWENVYDPIN